MFKLKVQPDWLDELRTKLDVCLRIKSTSIFMSSQWSDCDDCPINFSLPYGQITNLN